MRVLCALRDAAPAATGCSCCRLVSRGRAAVQLLQQLTTYLQPRRTEQVTHNERHCATGRTLRRTRMVYCWLSSPLSALPLDAPMLHAGE
jgi:hypothetical protein